MGMFTRDKQYGGLRLDQEFRIGDVLGVDPGELFVLYDAYVLPEPIETSIGNAEKSVLQCMRLDPETNLPLTGELIEVGTLSQAIAAKVKDKEEGDLPAVVRCHMVESKEEKFNDALVMSFVGEYEPPVKAKK
jgi:hypothetical protein